MAKKIRNLLLLGAAIGAAAAGTYYYLQKKDTGYFDEDDDDDEDFDSDSFDEDDDFTTVADSAASRNYVPLHFDSSASEASDNKAESKTESNVTLKDMDSVEEFFDDEDEEIEDETPIEEE